MRRLSATIRLIGLAIAFFLIVLLLGLRVASGPSTGAVSGVVVNESGACQGYTLIFPLCSTKTYLIDMQGRVVRTWQSNYLAGQDAYLLENGNLLRTADLGIGEAYFVGASKGGRIQEFNWDGELVWDFRFHDQTRRAHHAITRMANGNVLMIVWERKTAREAVAAGVKPTLAGNSDVLVDALIEVKPVGKTGGKIVWEWHAWDHLVQDYDPSQANYGDVAACPELIDVNFAWRAVGELPGFGPLRPSTKQDAPTRIAKDGKRSADPNLERLRSIGYIGASGGAKFQGYFPDWTHVNAVSYNPRFDQIMISVRETNEVWIIDHSTTTAEAAAHRGGKYGMGGDILYRWGNPRAYRAASVADQKLFAQHDAHWIPAGLPGEGNLLVFNNGRGRPDSEYSSVDEVVLPADAEGRYARAPGTAFGPQEPGWSYAAPKKSDFYAMFMSSAQRLRNGNTLISTGFGGTVFEVTPQKQVVWEYIVPLDFKPGADTVMVKASENPIFRAYRYSPDYPGLVGRDLTPGKTIQELQQEHVSPR